MRNLNVQCCLIPLKKKVYPSRCGAAGGVAATQTTERRHNKRVVGRPYRPHLAGLLGVEGVRVLVVALRGRDQLPLCLGGHLGAAHTRRRLWKEGRSA